MVGYIKLPSNHNSEAALRVLLLNSGLPPHKYSVLEGEPLAVVPWGGSNAHKWWGSSNHATVKAKEHAQTMLIYMVLAMCMCQA